VGAWCNHLLLALSRIKKVINPKKVNNQLGENVRGKNENQKAKPLLNMGCLVFPVSFS